MDIFEYAAWATLILFVFYKLTDDENPIKGLWLFAAICHGLLLAFFVTVWTYAFLGKGSVATLVAGSMAVAIIWFFFKVFAPRSGYDRDGRGWDDGGGE